MAKITVEVAAKRLGMEPTECLKRLQEMGLMVRDQLDKIDTDVFQQVKARLDEEKLRANTTTASTSERIGSRVIRRRRKTSDAEVEAEAEELPVEAVPAVEEEPPATPIKAEEPETQPVVAEEPATEQTVEPAAEEPVAKEATPVQAEPATPVEAEPEVAAPPDDEPEIIEEEDFPGEDPADGSVDTAQARRARRRLDIDQVKPKTIRFPEAGEPARILSTPKIPMEPIKPLVVGRDDAPPRDPADKPGSERRPRKGRRVVDFGDRGPRKDQERNQGFGRKGRPRKKKNLKQTEITIPKALKRKVKVPDQITVGDLCKRMGVKSGDVIKKLLGMGMMVTINQNVDFETVQIICAEFSLEVEKSTVEVADILVVSESTPEQLEWRPPVVTVMGHVDHGKTSVLDAIRETDVAAGEAGGITQHIGSYNVRLADGRHITFIDTPGHHSFAAMRARGAQVTDIVVLVVAADDGVMPQTIESINHAKAAGVPIVIAVNKIDKDNADPDKIVRQLMEYELIPESLGGETLFVHVSAKMRQGIDTLLETILLQSEMMELKADPNKNALAVVLDARLERGRGPVADIIVKEGTLKKGDFMISDTCYGRVRMMFDDKGKLLDSVTPALPAQVVGLNGVPPAGSVLNIVNDEKTGKAIASLRENKTRSEEQTRRANIRLEDLFAKAQEGKAKELKVVVKCDVHGSAEAVTDALAKLGNEEIQVNVIHHGVGTITETDINLASAGEAIIIGFNVRPEAKSKAHAESLGVEIRMYSVIYELIEEVTKALEGMLAPTFSESVNGVAEVRDTFHIRRIGTVAGCYVLEGKMIRNSHARVLRDGVVLYNGTLNNLKRFKDDAKEVATGFECGISIDGFNDVQTGDKIESFNVIEARGVL